MNNETQNTIQKIEESLARQNSFVQSDVDPIRKILRAIWIFLGLLLIVVTFITITGWLTVEKSQVVVDGQIQNY